MDDLTHGSIVLLGSTGMLGRAWCQLLQDEGVAFESPRRSEVDLADPETIADALDANARVVINCTAWTDVDGAETHEAEATVVNGEAVGALARRCAVIGATLVHFSTDYVFNGNAIAPYRVDTPRDPVNAYGRSKAVGEQMIEEATSSGGRALIVRTSWLYAPWRNNFVRTISRLATQRDSLKVVNDQRGRPTSAEHLAAATWRLLRRGEQGIYHVTDGGECTWFDFANEIARLAGSSCDVQPCTTAEFPRPAKRPAYSVLDLSKTEALIGPMPTWRDNLADVMRRLEPIHA